MRITSRVWLVAPAVLVGCVYSSRVKDRRITVPERYHAQGTTAAPLAEQALDKASTQRSSARRSGEGHKEGARGAWWRRFDDRRLDALVTQAMQRNRDLRATQARLQQAHARLKAATAGFFPSLSAGGEASRNQTVFNLPDPVGASTFRQNNFQLSLSASYELDLWGKVRFARTAAKQEVRASEEDLRAAKISVIANVVDGYYLAVQRRAQVRLLGQTIENRKGQLKLIEQRYASGVARPADLYQAKQVLAQAQAQAEEAKAQVAEATHALAVVVGRYPGQLSMGALEQLPTAVTATPGGLPGDLLLNRPDLRAAYARLRAIDARVGVAIAERFPSLTIGGSIGARFDPNGLIWSILAQLAAPIFQGGRLSAQVQQRKAELEEGIANFEKALLIAVREVEDAMARRRHIARQLGWLEQRVQASEGALRLSWQQYLQGVGGYLDVLAAEQAILASRSDLITARRGLISSCISLARSVGGDWLPVPDTKGARIEAYGG